MITLYCCVWFKSRAARKFITHGCSSAPIPCRALFLCRNPAVASCNQSIIFGILYGDKVQYSYIEICQFGGRRSVCQRTSTAVMRVVIALKNFKSFRTSRCEFVRNARAASVVSCSPRALCLRVRAGMSPITNDQTGMVTAARIATAAKQKQKPMAMEQQNRSLPKPRANQTANRRRAQRPLRHPHQQPSGG